MSDIKQTVIQEAIDFYKSMEDTQLEIKPSDIVKYLEVLLLQEEKQIVDAFEAGEVYGSSNLSKFDSPAKRYYSYYYKKQI